MGGARLQRRLKGPKPTDTFAGEGREMTWAASRPRQRSAQKAEPRTYSLMHTHTHMYTLAHVHTCSLTETHSHSHALISLVHPHGLTLTPANGQEEKPTTAAPGAKEIR